MRPKITNNISLETLRHVESINAIIFHSFGIQIESIFKLNQTYLLTYLNHTFIPSVQKLQICSSCNPMNL
jgi:hypothetical protein